MTDRTSLLGRNLKLPHKRGSKSAKENAEFGGKTDMRAAGSQSVESSAPPESAQAALSPLLSRLFIDGDRLPPGKTPGVDKLIAVTLFGAMPSDIPDEPGSHWRYEDGVPVAVLSSEYANFLGSLAVDKNVSSS